MEFFLQVNLQDQQDQLKKPREHQVALEDLVVPADPEARVVRGGQEVQEGPVGPVERQHRVLVKQQSQRNPQRNQALQEVRVDRVVLADQADPVVREDRVAPVALGDLEEKRHHVLEKQQSQPNQPRNRVHQVVQEVPRGLAVPEAQEVPEVLEAPVDREVPEVPEVRGVQEDPVVRVGLQRNLQEYQPRKQHQLRTPRVSPMAPVDQEVQGDPEDPVVRVDQEGLVDQEDQEVTEHYLYLLYVSRHIELKAGPNENENLRDSKDQSCTRAVFNSKRAYIK